MHERRMRYWLLFPNFLFADCVQTLTKCVFNYQFVLLIFSRIATLSFVSLSHKGYSAEDLMCHAWKRELDLVCNANSSNIYALNITIFREINMKSSINYSLSSD